MDIQTKIDSIVQKFVDKNYFFTEETIKSKTDQLQISERESLKESIILHDTNSAKKQANVLKTQIENKNIIYLTEIIRYDQKFSVAIFEAITDLKVPKTNAKIKPFLIDFCKKERQTCHGLIKKS